MERAWNLVNEVQCSPRCLDRTIRQRRTYDEMRTKVLSDGGVSSSWGEARACLRRGSGGGLILETRMTYQGAPPAKSMQVAVSPAETAVQKEPNKPIAVHNGTHYDVDRDLDRALGGRRQRSPSIRNSLSAIIRLRRLHVCGRPLEAIDTIERAMRLDPAWFRRSLHFLGTRASLRRL